jgi:hypothetical protein
MDRAFADAVILAALERDPEHVSKVIAKVARSLIESGSYSDKEVRGAIEELQAELESHGKPRQ